MLSPKQCAAARVILGWTTEQLASAAHVSVTAISHFERGHSDPQISTVRRLKLALSAAGVTFVEEDGKRGVLYPAELDVADLEELEGRRKR